MIVLYILGGLWLFTALGSIVFVSNNRNGGSGNLGILAIGCLWPLLPFIWAYNELKSGS